ncbi:cyclic nucleotide-gated cation channel beta-1-like isoform X2 [Sphaeramia orbicularis]|uniref:cyclic nucleotide-gated cation channel beta-1-like isoform X2 n=1 Tax=Sphaeramia orbicularis TaxID=375764 RepID=UPI0011804A64|nr:cyclic nucleotide-gated cation channel beta-1-like isoform X2 [Sphaeramia orbicularis]
MRPSSRQRVAAWLLALPLGRGGEECARRGRLEMISFWLLCWKLLRATAGLRRTAGELTDSSHNDSNSSNDNPVDDPHAPTQPTEPVTMEISSSPMLTDLERENLVSCHSQEMDGLHYPEAQKPVSDERETDEAAETESDRRNGEECDYLVFEIGEKNKRGEEEEVEDIGGRGEGEGDAEDIKEDVTEDIGEEKEEDDWRKEIEEHETKEDTEEETQGEDGGRAEDGYGDEEASSLSELLFMSDSVPAAEATLVTFDPPEQPAATMLQECWGQDLGNRDDLSDSHLSDCLQAELAVIYSDSDAGDDQWAAFPNQGGCETGGGGEGDEEERKEQEMGKEEQREEEMEESSIATDEEQMKSRRDLFLRSPSASSTASSTDPERRVPADFSVQQENLSENVSTEHVDFILARQQWKKMEAEVKGQPIPKPGLKAQGSFRGTHSSLYPPTRSPRIKHREIQPPVPREPPLSSTLSPGSEDSGLDDSSYRSPLEEPESAVEREIRLTLEREEKHRRERGMITQGLTIPRPSTLQTGRSPPRPPACRTPTLSVSPSASSSSSLPRSLYHEMTANNVIILEPDSTSRNRLLTTAVSGLSDWPASLDSGSTANVIVVETSNLIIRSASEFCLSSPPVGAETQESTFTSNPFFKLRSLSSQSLVEQEIRMVRQREEEWRRQREEMWKKRREEEWRKGRERYDTVLVSPGLNENISFTVPEVADRCVSSPSSPSRTRKMERSSLSCDHKFPPSLSSVPRRQNAMAQRWEASLLANQKKD